MRSPKRPVHHLSWRVLNRTGGEHEGVPGPPLCSAQLIFLQAEFMTFMSTASLMHKAKKQQPDSDTQVLEYLLLLGPRGVLTLSMGHHHLKPPDVRPSLSRWHTHAISPLLLKSQASVSDPRRSRGICCKQCELPS